MLPLEKIFLKSRHNFGSVSSSRQPTRSHKSYLSYDVAVIQWITSRHKNHTTLWRVDVTSLTTSVSTRRFLTEIKLALRSRIRK